MHNIFLGIAKHTMKTWRDYGIIGTKEYKIIQNRVDSMCPPSKIGRIPRKIVSGFAAVTADEWKYWILMYSVYSLYDLIPKRDFDCWCLLVDSCRLLCLPKISRNEIYTAHLLLVQFCKSFEDIYGTQNCTQNCTPNMHMACHLKESLQEFGPLTAFWCFPFERYNGIIEEFNKSWFDPEKQMFRKFLDIQSLNSFRLHHGHRDSILNELFSSNEFFQKSFEDYSSFQQSQPVDTVCHEQIKSLKCSMKDIDATEKSYHAFLGPLKEKCFDETEFFELKQMYDLLHPVSKITHMSRFYQECKNMLINKEEFISVKSRSQRSAAIAAFWPKKNEDSDVSLRVGLIKRFFRHEIRITDEKSTSCQCIHSSIAQIDWFDDHTHHDYIHQSVVVCASVSHPTALGFIPVSRIAGRAAFLKTSIQFPYGDDSVVVAIPMLKAF